MSIITPNISKFAYVEPSEWLDHHKGSFPERDCRLTLGFV